MSQNGSSGKPRSWLRDTMSAWLCILTVSGDRSLSLEQRAELLTEVNGPVRLNVKLRRFIWPWQRAAVDEALDATGTAALDALNGYLIAAMLSHEHLIARLGQATGQTREQLLQELSISIEQRIAAAEDHTSDGDGNNSSS